jgi:Icc-related predicted phosphoesterase
VGDALRKKVFTFSQNGRSRSPEYAVIAVLGNHDSLVSTTQLPAKIVVLDGNVVKTNFGLRVGGLGGIIGDPKRHNRWDENTFVRHMELCIQKRLHVLMLHQGPEDKEGRRVGNPAISQSLEKGFSGLTIFGHKHWPDSPLIDIGNGQALNLDARVVVVSPADSY